MKRFDFSLLNHLVPVNQLSDTDKEVLVEYLHLESYQIGQIIFNEGERDNNVFYLYQGEVELKSRSAQRIYLKAGSNESNYPLSQVHPRQYTATALSDTTILRVDKDKLDNMVASCGIKHQENGQGVLVSEVDNDNDWMTSLLSTDLFKTLSANAIQKIFSGVEYFEVENSEVVFTQGDEARFYYYLHTGKCEISRRPTETAQSIIIQKLSSGSFFGEESLIRNTMQDYTVKMLSRGELIKINKDVFKSVLLEICIEKLDIDDLDKLQRDDVVMIDVRFPDEVDIESNRKILNIPYNLIHLEAGKLDRNLEYVVVCGDGVLSQAAAFILAKYGLTAGYIEGGVKKFDDKTSRNSLEITTVAGRKTDDSNISQNTDHLFKTTENTEIMELRHELEEIKARLESDINSQHEELLSKVAEEKAREVFASEYKQIQNIMSQAVMMYENTKEIKNKLLEERKILKKTIESHKLWQARAINTLESEANKKIENEVERINSFYKDRENQIKELKRIRDIAQRKYYEHKEDEPQINRKTATARLDILKDKSYRKHISDLNRKETESVIDDLKNIEIQANVSSVNRASILEQNERKPVDVESINQLLLDEYNNMAAEHNENSHINSDIKQWSQEQSNIENSSERIQELERKKEIIRRIYEHSRKSKTLSKIHDKALLSEIDVALEKKDSEEC